MDRAGGEAQRRKEVSGTSRRPEKSEQAEASEEDTDWGEERKWEVERKEERETRGFSGLYKI